MSLWDGRRRIVQGVISYSFRLSSSSLYLQESWVKGTLNIHVQTFAGDASAIVIVVWCQYSNLGSSKPCGIRAARKLRVVRRQERWADKVCSIFVVADGVEVQEGPQHFFH